MTEQPPETQASPKQTAHDVPGIVLQSVGIDSDGSLQIGFYRPTLDVKSNGLAHMHTLLIPVGSDYDDEIREVLNHIEHLVLDALDDEPRLGPPEE